MEHVWLCTTAEKSIEETNMSFICSLHIWGTLHVPSFKRFAGTPSFVLLKALVKTCWCHLWKLSDSQALLHLWKLSGVSGLLHFKYLMNLYTVSSPVLQRFFAEKGGWIMCSALVEKTHLWRNMCAMRVILQLTD